MIGFGVADDEIVDVLGVDLLFEAVEIELPEFFVGGVHQGNFFASDEEGVIGGSVL